MKKIPEQPQASEVPASKTSVGQHALHGAFWSLFFAIANKITTLGSQLVLPWFLLPSDFGLAALTLSISGILNLISMNNLSDILIQQKDELKFKEAFGQIFWITNLLNLILVGLPIMAAVWIAKSYHKPELAPVLILVELNSAITGAALVYGAALKRSLQFKTLAYIFFIAGTIQSLVSIGMAWLGLGAYSIIVPMVISTLISFIFQIRATHSIPLNFPQPKLWYGYLSSGFWLLALGGLLALPSQVTIFIMSFSKNSVQIGLYFWGFSLASQVVYLICNNLRQIFFPTLVQLNGMLERQTSALKKSAHFMLSVIAYFCVLQAVTAGPLIGLIFPNRWQNAAPVVSWISLGMLTQPLSVLCFSLYMAQGRYRTVAKNSLIQGVLVALCALIGCIPKTSNAQSAAAWTALGFLLGGLYCGWDMLASLKGGWSALLQLLAKPMLTTLACGFAGVLAASASPVGNPFRGLALDGLAVSLAYILSIWIFDIEILEEIKSRIFILKK